MNVLGIETSCDECAISIVEDGKRIHADIVASQIEIHKRYYGVVPEIASRMHVEWIQPVLNEALEAASMSLDDIDGIAVTNRPGLVGSLLVGFSFGKALALARNLPFVGVDHIRAHLYAPMLESDISYPFIGLLVSGGHTIICKVTDFDEVEVLGTTIDDAAGEAFDKVAKYYDLGFPGGSAIDKLSTQGNMNAYSFPMPSLHKGEHRYDVSYSGLKTAVINQLEKFHNKDQGSSKADIAASFQKTAIDMLLKRVRRVIGDTGIHTLVAGGGVAANSYLRSQVAQWNDVKAYFPSLKLCTDNGAMIAGIGYHYLMRGDRSHLDEQVSARVGGFRKTYP
jgi:N6-L-threonylcarbamoyladenine synthase